jgi:hypothetical protein
MDTLFEKSEIPLTAGDKQTKCVNQSPVDYFLKYFPQKFLKILKVNNIDKKYVIFECSYFFYIFLK